MRPFQTDNKGRHSLLSFVFINMGNLREDTVEETKATLKVLRTSGRYVFIYSKIEKAIVCSLARTQVANCISNGTIFCSYVPETALSTANYPVHP